MRKTLLPPGFRFHPTDVELVKYYLKRKVMGKKLHFEAIAEVDVYKYAPWDLPDKSCLRSGDLKWYFFCPRARKFGSGLRMNRSTDFGFWKATGKDRLVCYSNEVIGMIRTLVFHVGRAPKGQRTDWVMHEYRLEEKELANRGIAQDVYMLCVIFKKDGPGPKNGAQYGAPFKEEDWDDDEEDEVYCGQGVFSASVSVPPFVLPINQNSSMFPNSCVLDSRPIQSFPSLPSEALPYANNPLPVVSNNGATSMEASKVVHEGDDLLAMLANFSEESTFILNENDSNDKVDNLNNGGNIEFNPSSAGIDIYEGLADLANLAGLDEPGYNISSYTTMYTKRVLEDETEQFLELRDLDVPLNFSSQAGGCECFQTGGVYADNHYDNNSDQLFSLAKSCGVAKHVDDFCQSYMPPNGPYGFENQ